MARQFLGKVFGISAVPTTTGCFFAVNPVRISGTAAESAALALAPDLTTYEFAYVMGGRPPVAGDVLMCHEVNASRGTNPADLALRPQPFWIAERIFQGGGININGCACSSMPPTLTMTSSNQTSNNGMFQDATLTYGPTPSAYAGLAIGPSSYLSTASYTDQFNNNFRYYFYCQRNQFFLTRVYVNSIFGSPYEDSIRYTWTVGTGNTCSPFLMSDGRVYAGGDTSVIVTVSG